jgi:hypothetical protein
VSRQLDSLHVWRVFAHSQIGNRFHEADYLPQTSLEICCQLITSQSAVWITDLSIYLMDDMAADLTKISTISNLHKLHVGNSTKSPYSRLDDRVLRAWADAARDQGSFSHVKHLKLHDHKGITKWSLERLSSFPALANLALHGCNLSKQDIEILILRGWIEPHRCVPRF